MDAFNLRQTIADREQQGRSYLEFLRITSMSAGVYFLPAGSVDPQKPHAEDELYYVVKGRGSVEVDEQHQLVEPETLILVRAGSKHRFHSITEDLTLLVFFSPAESS